MPGELLAFARDLTVGVADLPLETLDEVVLIDSQLGASLQLVVRLDSDRLVLLDVEHTATTLAELRFLEEAIGRTLHRDQGSEDDLPPALRQLSTSEAGPSRG